MDMAEDHTPQEHAVFEAMTAAARVDDAWSEVAAVIESLRAQGYVIAPVDPMPPMDQATALGVLQAARRRQQRRDMSDSLRPESKP